MTDAEPEQVRAYVTIADFANVDAGGKINIIGAGISVLGPQPTGQTAPFAVFVRLSTPLPLDEAVAVEVLLADSSGDVVMTPNPESGELQAVRVGQNVSFDKPQLSPLVIPKGALPSTAQMVLNFPTGLPLSAGQSYTFRVQVDHEVIASESIYVPKITGPTVG